MLLTDRDIYEVEDAVSALTCRLSSIKSYETVSLNEASGRILSEDITAPVSVPSFPKSAMDGYAVRSSDISSASADSPVRLKVIALMTAGDMIPDSVKGTADLEGCAVRIMTGAVVPSGFDTVIRQEDTDYGESEVLIFKAQGPYVNYCRIGEDIKEGQTVCSSGTLIGRAEAGVLASLGICEVKVLRKIRVSVISTGSEIVEPGTELKEGQIYNSISYMLASSLNKPSFEVITNVVPDDIDKIVEVLTEAEKYSDIIITTGGVSVGQKDLLPEAVDRIGAVKVFSNINIKPGSPTIGAVINGKALICLSGNPYAAVANYDLYVSNAAASITGCKAFIPERQTAVLQSDYEKTSNIRRLVRAYVCSGEVTIHTKNQASSVLGSYLNSNCYIDFPKGSNKRKGDKVDIIMIPEALL